MAFSSDGRFLASGSEEQTVLLWDVATRQQVGQAMTGVQVQFNPAGSLLAAGTSGGVELRDMDTCSWAGAACQRANRNLTRAEWDRFIGAEQPYCRICREFIAGDGAPAGAPPCP